MTEIPIDMLYPHINFIEDRGFIPNVHLPMDFEQRVPRFYAGGGRETLETYSNQLREQFAFSPEIQPRLLWDDKRGLTSIKVSSNAGLDLNERGVPNFQEHNMGGMMSLDGYAIATRYVKELLRV